MRINESETAEQKPKHVELPKFYFSVEVFWLKVTGIDLLKKDESVWYKCYSAFCVLFALAFVLTEIIELSFQSDFKIVCAVILFLIYHGLTMVKVCVVYKSRKQMGNLMKSFHDGFYKPDKTRGGAFEEKRISTVLKTCNLQFFYCRWSVLLALAAGIVSSLKSRLILSSENWILPYAPISWIDISHSPTFEIAFVYQISAILLNCVWNYLCDCTIISIIAQTTAQLNILDNSIKTYKDKILKRNKEEFSTDVLHKIIKHHVSLLGTIDNVEYLCSYLVLCVFLGTLTSLGFSMYFAATLPLGSNECILYFISYFAIGGQLLLYCWWGNEMTLANEKFALSVSQAYDPEDPIRNSKTLQQILVKAQKPLFFNAGRFVPLSLETFKSIIKSSYSYFTVLRQMNVK